MLIDARGRDARGNGTAAAKVTATLTEQGDSTLVQVGTDLDITGKPAQFGRGVMVDVGNKLIGQFADNLAETISADRSEQPTPSEPPTAEAETDSAAVSAAQPERPTQRAKDPEPINLIESAGPAVAKRLAPVAAGLLVLTVLFVIRRRR